MIAPSHPLTQWRDCSIHSSTDGLLLLLLLPVAGVKTKWHGEWQQSIPAQKKREYCNGRSCHNSGGQTQCHQTSRHVLGRRSVVLWLVNGGGVLHRYYCRCFVFLSPGCGRCCYINKKVMWKRYCKDASTEELAVQYNTRTILYMVRFSREHLLLKLSLCSRSFIRLVGQHLPVCSVLSNMFYAFATASRVFRVDEARSLL